MHLTDVTFTALGPATRTHSLPYRADLGVMANGLTDIDYLLPSVSLIRHAGPVFNRHCVTSVAGIWRDSHCRCGGGNLTLICADTAATLQANFSNARAPLVTAAEASSAAGADATHIPVRLLYSFFLAPVRERYAALKR